MNRFFWLAAVLALAGFDVWCFMDHWSAVAGNTAASIIWTTPVVAAHHLVTRRRQDRQHAEHMAGQRAQAQALSARRRDLAVVAAQVGQLHQLHIHGVWPEDKHRGR